MFKIDTDMYVIRRQWTRYSRKHFNGSGYCEDQGEYQLLMKRWKLGQMTIWKKVIDREEIPSHVTLQRGCFGSYTGDWKSKFLEYIPVSRGGTMQV